MPACSRLQRCTYSPHLGKELRFGTSSWTHYLKHLAWAQPHVLVDAEEASRHHLSHLPTQELGSSLIRCHKPQQLLL